MGDLSSGLPSPPREWSTVTEAKGTKKPYDPRETAANIAVLLFVLILPALVIAAWAGLLAFAQWAW